ncbi:tetratricopeptide repeat protein [Flavobacterium franklandianum]|uniref:sensor histidine kinase n=1 Tax=Flavobacterium franklandianum TaxID=2594430 RepID=UPI00117B8412|nr:tetratricopeptide repeat protein [Flavobacterium franklandianum]TRX24803.1 tetratricopeptide repeat protein [Flavobacterium franklandianum]
MRKTHFLLILFSQIVFSQNIPLVDLQKKLDNEKKAVIKLEILNEMVSIAFNGDIEQALAYAKKGVQLSDKIGDKNWQPKFYEMQGRMHANLLQLDSASLYFDKAMKGYLAITDKKGQATTLFKMAWVLKKKGENEKALQKNLQALKLMESLGDKAGICDALNRISEDLTNQNRLSAALNYAEKAIAIAETNNLTTEKFYVNFNAGNVAMALGNYKQSLDYYNAAAKIVKKENLGLATQADVTNAQGNALKRLGRYKEALINYKKCVALAKEANYANAIAASFANLGEINMLLGNYKEALGYQLKTVQLQEQENDVSNLVENYHHVSKIYKELGDFKLALDYKQKAYNLRDSIASVKSDAAMSKLLTQYETKKKEETIATQESKISQQKLIQRLSFVLVALLIILLLFGFIGLRNRNKSNRLLAIKNAENELLLKEIHHRVKNNLEVVSSLLALQSAQIDDPNTKDAMSDSRNRVNSIGIVHQKLYQGSNLGAIEMKDYLLNLSESILDSFGVEKKIELHLAMDKLDLDIDTAVPLGLIINELLTNAIKYAFPKEEKGTITIKLEKQNIHFLHLEVADNGVGKSGITHGTGFGGQLVSLLTQQLNGIMTEKSQNGTTLIFDFKLKVA